MKLGACLLNELFNVRADRNSSRRHAPCAMGGLYCGAKDKIKQNVTNMLAEWWTLKSDGHIVTQIHSFVYISLATALNTLEFYMRLE
jgi:hypothetical protein